MIRTKDPGNLVTVSLTSFGGKLRSPSNLVVPCASMLQREKLFPWQELRASPFSTAASVGFNTKTPRRRYRITREIINWVWIFYWVLALKIFVSTPNLRNMVPFFHLLVAIDNYYTPYKFGFREPNRWGPRGEKPILGYFGAPSGRFFGCSPGTPTFRFSDSKFVWRVAVVSNFQYVKKWDNISKIWRGYEDFNPPGAIPNKKSIPHL